MGKFIGWLGGMLTAVIGGWLVWYLTRPPATTTFEGMVINGEASAPVAGAMVSVEIKGIPSSEPYHDFTDEHGSYRIDFTGLSKSSGATGQGQARDFQPAASTAIATVVLDNRHDFVLKPLAMAGPNPPPPTSPGVAVGHVPPAAMVKYVPKPAKQAISIQLRR